ncbi:MAG: GGDEF domain-containing protein [Lachnospiraceae bacterium]|nr:GGDEF domain-containing protein [Lachnospiraceae bacterium]
MNKIQSSETFFMMSVLTENYSVVDMARKLEQYPKKMGIHSMVLFLTYDFCVDTDVPHENMGRENLILLSQFKDGEYSVLCEETPVRQIYKKMIEVFWKRSNILYIPIHIQEENYGFMAVAFEECKRDLIAFYNFAMGLDQSLGTIKKQSQLHKMYITDNMTQLYNRRGFFSHLEADFNRLSGKDLTLFVSSVDMDGLKFINDTYGHAEGDFAIRKTAEFLRESLKGKSGICARFGGDEYMVAMLEETEQADFTFYERYDEILQGLADDFEKISDKPYQVGVSIGSIHSVVHGMGDVDELMKKADAVMYDCKSMHHNSRLARLRETSREDQEVCLCPES